MDDHGVGNGGGVGGGGGGVGVGGSGVLVGGTGVLVGGTGVLVGGSGVLVGGTGVFVGVGVGGISFTTCISLISCDVTSDNWLACSHASLSFWSRICTHNISALRPINCTSSPASKDVTTG